jgi:hypothetical protein
MASEALFNQPLDFLHANIARHDQPEEVTASRFGLLATVLKAKIRASGARSGSSTFAISPPHFPKRERSIGFADRIQTRAKRRIEKNPAG